MLTLLNLPLFIDFTQEASETVKFKCPTHGEHQLAAEPEAAPLGTTTLRDTRFSLKSLPHHSCSPTN